MSLLGVAMAQDLRAALSGARSAPVTDSPAPDRPAIWTAHEGPQADFCTSAVDEVLYGGAKGGGKSMAVIGLMIPWIGHPDFRGLILRRETTGLVDIIGKAKKIFQQGQSGGARPFAAAAPGVRFVGTGGVSGGAIATFPSGATIRFGHCKTQDDWLQYQGQEFHIVAFEELTQFIERQYLEIKSCVRSGAPGLPRQVRATTNPGSVGHEFVFGRWKYWLDPDAEIAGREPRLDARGERLPPCRSGDVLHIRRNDDDSESVFVEPQFDAAGAPTTSSRTFIAARLEDNPTLMHEDPSYQLKLQDFDLVRRAQLRDGDWLVKPSAGMYFQTSWVEVVERGPEVPVARLRYWDRAAGEPSSDNPDPDWTVGTRWALGRDGFAYVEHVDRFRRSPLKVKQRIRELADEDAALPGGCAVALEQDPAQAGKFEIAEYLLHLQPHEVIVVPKRPGDDKEAWFRPCSRACENHMVKVVRGPWNKQAFAELMAFPFGSKDDVVDTWGGGYTQVVLLGRRGRTTTTGSATKSVSMHRGGGGF